MNTILLGNAVAFIGAIVMVATGLIKSKKNILIAQSVQFTIMGIGNLILGGFTGFMSNMVSIVRNVVCLKTTLTVPLKLLFIAIQIILGGLVNNLGLIGWMPVCAACIFTWILDTDNEILLKAVIIAMQVMWCIFDFTIQNYISLAMDLFTIISNAAGIFLIKKAEKNSGEAI